MTSTQDKREKKLAKQIQEMLGADFVSYAHALGAARGETEVLAPTEELRDALLLLGVKSKLGAPKPLKETFDVLLREEDEGVLMSTPAGFAFSLEKAKEIGTKKLKKFQRDGHPKAWMTVSSDGGIVFSSRATDQVHLED